MIPITFVKRTSILRKAVVFTLIFLFALSKIHSQDVYKQNINTVHGLPSNTVYDILQDKDGFIWIATSEGVVRYDGTFFKEFKSKNLNSIVGSNLKIDRYKRIWYETFDGYLLYIEKDSVKTFQQKTPLGFLNFSINQDTLKYFSTAGIEVLDIKTLKPITCFKTEKFAANFLTKLNTKTIAFEGSRTFLVQEKNKLRRIQNNLDSIYSPIYFEANQTIYITDKTNKNPYFYRLNDTKFEKTHKIKSKSIIQNIFYQDDKFWICTNDGLILMDNQGNEIQHIFKKNSITSILKDKNNIFCIGTHNNGIFKIENFNEIAIDLSNIKPLKINVNDAEINLGNEFGELFEVNLDFKRLKKLNFNSSNEISLINTKHQKFNFIVSNGLYQTDKNFNILIHSEFAVKSISILNDNEIAMAASGLTGFKKIDRYEDLESDFGNFTYKNNFKNLQKGVRGKVSFLIPNSKKILFASNMGLYLYDQKAFKELKFNDKTLFIKLINQVGKKTILISTDAKIYILENDRISKSAFDIDKITNLKNVNEELFLISKDKIYEWKSDNFKRINLNIAEKVIDFDANKDYFFVLLSNQLVKFNRKQKTNAEQNSKLIVEELLVNGMKKGIDKNNEFNYNQNNIEISFSKIDYSNLQHPIVYRINNGNWTELSNTNALKLAALSPNEYRVEMKIKGDKTTLQTIEFKIRKPYWQQSWFIILLISSLLIMFFFIYQYRISILSKKKNLEIEKITLENHLNENRLKLIKAQMNPHFFFNALNTIQSFIATNETDEATSYLDNFSKLTRLILEMTDKNTISIEEEIKMQNLYLSLQKIRLNDFEFEIKCEPKCLERAQIPTMLIQPYIENAIIHGLSHKKGTKKLKIYFVEIENNKLEIVVLDNGIGIKKANEINSKSKTKSASFATKATLERIEIINRNNFTIAIETNEIVENEISQGTEVKIKMNLAYESL